MINRRGYIAGIILLVLIASFMLSWVIYSVGSSRQSDQKNLLEKGYDRFNKGKIEKAIKYFDNAKATFGFPLTVYRFFNKSDEYLTKDDIDLILVNAFMSVAYDDFFRINPSKKWVKKAKSIFNLISKSAQTQELQQLLSTLESCSNLCSLYKQNKLERALKDLLKVEKKSVEGDVDFFIFEIKFMIECGKRLRSQVILARARELLFFLSYELNIQNDKTNSLWKSLTKM